jgi:hypothetical protein
MKPALLQAVVDEMDVCGDEVTAYINKKTGELISVGDEEAGFIGDGGEDDDFIPDWQKEILPKVREVLESGDFVPLPDKFAIHEYSIMERFCLSMEDDDLRDELLNAIRGRGAFRCFKDTIRRKGIQDDWHSYRNDARKRIAAAFLEMEGVAFVDDGFENGT